jgi:site-specific DNA-cytosine methylase
MKKILYLASGNATINTKHKVIYNDYNIQRDIKDDMLNVHLNGYDMIIATPPCNYYSRANWKRERSEYALSTKHLLPSIIKRLEKLDIPILIENVRNPGLMKDIINNTNLFYVPYGRHSYFVNRFVDFTNIPQKRISIYKFPYSKYGNGRQGDSDINEIIDYYIKMYLD